MGQFVTDMGAEWIKCPLCEGEHKNPLHEHYSASEMASRIERRMKGKELIQDVFPELNPAQREIIMTGICTPCWDAV